MQCDRQEGRQREAGNDTLLDRCKGCMGCMGCMGRMGERVRVWHRSGGRVLTTHMGRIGAAHCTALHVVLGVGCVPTAHNTTQGHINVLKQTSFPRSTTTKTNNTCGNTTHHQHLGIHYQGGHKQRQSHDMVPLSDQSQGYPAP